MIHPDEYLSAEQYNEAAEALHVLSGMLLFEFARQNKWLYMSGFFQRSPGKRAKSRSVV